MGLSNNLYSNTSLITNQHLQNIKPEPINLPYRYTPYPFQSDIYNAFAGFLDGENTYLNYLICGHRRMGKDYNFWQLVILAAAKVAGDYLYMLPTSVQAKKVILNAVVQDNMGNPCGFKDFIPPNLNPIVRISENMITLSNGSNIYVCGSDNAKESLVGMNAKGAVMSEAALSNKEALEFIKPMLKRNNKIDPRTGWLMLCSTPRGKNWFYEMWKIAQLPRNKNLWFFRHFTVEDTTDHKGEPLVTKADIQQDIDDGYDENIIKQEYYLDFEAIVKGYIYSKQIKQARDEGRVRHIDINPTKPVLTFWDLGISDEMTIWFMQQGTGKDSNLYLINYYSNAEEGLDHYVEYMKTFAQKYGCKYGTVYFPHDGAQREIIMGEKRHTAMANKGFDVKIIPRTSDVELAIRQTKELFPRFVFDGERCAEGIRCIDNYRRKTPKTDEGVLGSPIHDIFSHGADSLRQIGQYYADKFVADRHDEDKWSTIQDELNEQYVDEYEYVDDDLWS
jgi:hypothetical protein